MEKKRYILFGFDGYYPSGGMTDARASFNDDEYQSVVEAERYKDGYKYENYQIFDTQTFKIYKQVRLGEMPRINVIND